MEAHRTRVKRRKHRHFEAKVLYTGGEVFERNYTDREKTRAFAESQKNSPVVRSARVSFGMKSPWLDLVFLPTRSRTS
jgi:hypothetical protein